MAAKRQNIQTLAYYIYAATLNFFPLSLGIFERSAGAVLSSHLWRSLKISPWQQSGKTFKFIRIVYALRQ